MGEKKKVNSIETEFIAYLASNYTECSGSLKVQKQSLV